MFSKFKQLNLFGTKTEDFGKNQESQKEQGKRQEEIIADFRRVRRRDSPNRQTR